MMLLVTAYPMLQALYLSLFRYRLTTPGEKQFVGLGNYATALTDSLFWQDLFNTVVIMVISVAVELVIGFAFAMVMHRIIVARGLMRTSILIPYGIITVVSAFAWQFAFSLNNGFVNGWFQWLPWISAGHQLVRLPLAGDVRDHRLRDLEDHPVHGPAAAGRAVPGLRGHARGRPGRRRDVVAAAVQGDPAEHARGDHGGGAVPCARRVPDLRQHLRDDEGRPGHRVAARS